MRFWPFAPIYPIYPTRKFVRETRVKKITNQHVCCRRPSCMHNCCFYAPHRRQRPPENGFSPFSPTRLDACPSTRHPPPPHLLPAINTERPTTHPPTCRILEPHPPRTGTNFPASRIRENLSLLRIPLSRALLLPHKKGRAEVGAMRRPKGVVRMHRICGAKITELPRA